MNVVKTAGAPVFYDQYTQRTNLSTLEVTALYGPSSRMLQSDMAVMNGELTPRFHERRRKGELLPYTPWYQKEETGLLDHGEYRVDDTGSGEKVEIIPYWNAHSVHTANGDWRVSDSVLSDQLVGRLDELDNYVKQAAAKMYSSNGWDSLTFIAELRPTLRMFKNVGRRLESFNKDARRFLNSKTKLNDARKVLANNWLEGRYGWRVLAYDLQDLGEALARASAKARSRFSERTGGTQRWTDLWVKSFEGTDFHWTYNVEDYYTLSARGAVTADVRVPNFQFNPLLTGWEVIPYSFVVDWFIDVGNTLEALSLTKLATSYVAGKGYKLSLERRMFTSNVSYVGNGSGAYLGFNADYKLELTQRYPASVSTIPNRSIRLNMAKVTDLVALVSQWIR